MTGLGRLLSALGKQLSDRAEARFREQAWRDAVENRKNSDADFVERRRASSRAKCPDPGTDTADNGLQGA